MPHPSPLQPLPPACCQRPVRVARRPRAAVLRVAALATAVTAASSAWAFGGGVNTTLGRQVAARPDAPAVATTGHVRATWVLHCSGCHGVDGRGAPDKYVPDLRGVGHWLRVPGGRQFVISVPGVMASGLDDAQVAAVANWLLSTLAAASVPAGTAPYTAAEVAQARAQPLTDVAGTRERLKSVAVAGGVPID